MNAETKQKQTQTRKTKLWSPKKGGKPIRGIGLTDTNYYTENRYATGIYCIGQGTITSVL